MQYNDHDAYSIGHNEGGHNSSRVDTEDKDSVDECTNGTLRRGRN